ncbi:MAG: radical SAM protein [Desulfuromonadales bacterium]|nr:radical SAM protein [Desulfuromonadales bacterium]
MSWKIISKLKAKLDAESGMVTKKRGGSLCICLVYPNSYYAGMSNLGFQALYGLFNSYPDILCERAFLPDKSDIAEHLKSGTPLLSLESQKPLSDFDIIAFSVSFEMDYLNIPTIFKLSNIPSLSSERSDYHPVVIAGGAAIFLNPEPVADFFDIACIGEAEEILPSIIHIIRDIKLSKKWEFLSRFESVTGIYLPKRNDGSLEVSRAYAKSLDDFSTTSLIHTPDTEFGDMYLIELSRGCPRGCRFCAAGYIYLPYRQRSKDFVISQVEDALNDNRKIGLVAAAVGDFRGVEAICDQIMERHGKVSVSSLRIDGFRDEMLDLLVSSGHKTATLAPEGGSQRLRDFIKKGISKDQIIKACERLTERDILNIKLYFIIGLPTETDEDIEEMTALVKQIREVVIEKARVNKRLGEITLSINPFIPKPFTPFQWCGMAPQKILEHRIKLLKKSIGNLPNITIQVENLKDAMLQALISRGDRKMSTLILKSAETGSWKKAGKELRINIEEMVTRDIPLDEKLPWDFIEGNSKEVLLKEYREAFEMRSAVRNL